MSRTRRQQAILDIVAERPVQSQLELVEELRRRGLAATQATVSRDLRQLGLLKLPMLDGGSRYVAPRDVAGSAHSARAGLRLTVEQFVTEVGEVESLVLVRTPPGRANAVAVAIDEARLPGVAGTLAGDDTLLLLLRQARDRPRVIETFRGLMEGS